MNATVAERVADALCLAGSDRTDAAELARPLEPLDASAWPDVSDRFSMLTADGFPAEISVSPVDGSHALTVEPGPPEGELAGRAARSASMVEVPPGAFCGGVLASLLAVQQRYPERLRWGGWLGARMRDGHQRRKLYVEVPLDGRVRPERRLRMVGLEPATGRVERYHRVDRDPAGVLRATFEARGLGERWSEVGDLLGRLSENDVGPVPERDVGLSIAYDGSGAVAAVSVIVFAHAVIGNDALVRRRILGTGSERGWSSEAYAALTEPIRSRAGGPPYHGMITITVGPGAPLGLHVGVRPPT